MTEREIGSGDYFLLPFSSSHLRHVGLPTDSVFRAITVFSSPVEVELFESVYIFKWASLDHCHERRVIQLVIRFHDLCDGANWKHFTVQLKWDNHIYTISN